MKHSLKNFTALFLVLVMSLSFIAFTPATEASASGEVFIIDPGHGGTDPGAMNGTREEADDVLKLSLRIGELMSQVTTVAYTRTTDIYWTLSQRCSIANNNGSSYFISVHRNSFSSSSALGLETYYASKYTSSSTQAKMATAVQNSIMAAVPQFVNRGVKTAQFTVIWGTNMPSCLVEVGFISNPGDNVLFDTYFEDIAVAIANGMLSMIGKSIEAGPGNKLNNVAPLYLGENFDGFIKHSATGNLITDNDTNLISAAPEYTEKQRWHFVYNSDDGSYSILNDAKGKYIDVPYGDYSDNTALWLCDYNGLHPQRFWIYYINASFYFRTTGSTKVFDLNAYTNQLELCGEDIGTTEAASAARAFEILKINNDYSKWYFNLGEENSVYIRNTASGKMMTASDMSVIFTDATFNEDQRWIMARRADGSYEFKSVSTGLYLDVANGGLAEGTAVDLYYWNGLRPQGFYVLPNESYPGNYYIKPCYSHTVCDMNANNLDLNLATLNTSSQTSLNAQTFEIVFDGIIHNTVAPEYLGDSFYGYLTGKASGKTLTDNNGASLTASNTTYAENQKFLFEYDSNTLTYKITGASGKCIDVTYTYYGDGSAIGLYDDNGWVAQKFRFYEIDGYYYISPFYTNKLVDISSYDSSTVQLYGFELADYRAFTLKIAEEAETPVVTDDEVLVLKSDSALVKDGKMLKKVVSGAVASGVLSQFENASISVSDNNGSVVDSSASVGTGCTVNLYSNGVIVDSAVIIVNGDVTGDGIVDSTDYLRIKSAFLGIFEFDDASYIAANVDGSEVIDSTDYLRVKAHFLGTYNLYA